MKTVQKNPNCDTTLLEYSKKDYVREKQFHIFVLPIFTIILTEHIQENKLQSN
jgi:hypothetical protein